jgi:hypothetical protein
VPKRLPNPAPRSLLLAAVLFSGVLGAGSPLLAQGERSKDSAPPALKGPEVSDRNVPGATPDFGMGANGRRFAERLPPDVFRRAVGVLMGPDAPEDIRASEELQATIKAHIDGFEASVRKFRRDNAKELEALRAAAGEPATDRRRPQADRAKAMQDLTPEQQKARDEARVKLRELTASGPKIEDIYTKIWTELSEPQREAVQGKLDEWRKEQSARREDEYVRRQTARMGKETPPAARPAPANADDAMTAPMDAMEKKDATPAERARPSRDAAPGVGARRERLMRLFNELSPDEQEQLLQRLEERFKERRRGASNRPGKPAGKPPADVDRVKVPAPESDPR